LKLWIGFLMLAKFVIHVMVADLRVEFDKIFIVFYETLLDCHKVKSKSNT